MNTCCGGLMSRYGFKIRFMLPEGISIHHETDTLAISLPPEDHAVLLQSATNQSLKDSRSLIIRGSGFASADEAFASGRRVKNSLMVCSTELGLGMDIGDDKATTGVGKTIKDEAKKAGFMMLNDVHGLCIYPEDIPVTFSCVKGTAAKGISTVSFIRELSKAYNLACGFSDKQALTFEFYSTSKWLPSKKARLFLLMNAIESFACPANNTEKISRIIDKLIELTKDNLQEQEKDEFISRMEDLKTLSTTVSCMKLIMDRLGDDAAEVYALCLTARKGFILDGKAPAGIDIEKLYPKLDEMVARLILENTKGTE